MMRKPSRISLVAALAAGILPAALTGCQTTVGGQTLPSPRYLRDDVSYYPAGPEFILSNQVRAIEQYNLDREGFQDNFGGDADGAAAGQPGAMDDPMGGAGF